MHEVLVNRLGGLSLPRKSVVRLTDHPDMTLDVYRGRKTTIQLQQLKWIKNFFDNRKQAVVINGISSDSIPVSSGVPQGSFLGPILFLAYINDLPEQVKSKVRLFADDTAMYLAISSLSETSILQDDLIQLEK